LNVSGPTLASATFTPATVGTTASLSLSLQGNGTVSSEPQGIDCPGACIANFTTGTGVILTATPDPDWMLASWGSACAGSQPQCTLNMDANKTVSATFALAEQRLSVSTSGGGAVRSEPVGIDCGQDCTESYPSDSNILLTAVPEPGWVLASWGGACSGSEQSCTVAMNADRIVSARFVEDGGSLTVVRDGQGSVTSEPAGIDCGLDCEEAFASGTQVALTAVAETGWEFVGWGGACTGTDECLLVIEGAMEVVANFMESNAPHRLDNPINGSFESGIGIADGWVCEAEQVSLQINDEQDRIQAAYGAERPDSEAICGDTANGFAAVVNWNSYGDGLHRVKLFADDQLLMEVEVNVTTLGLDFLTGAEVTSTVEDFPAPGLRTVLAWSEPHQNFVVANPAALSAVRFGAREATPNNWESPLDASFESGRSLIRGWSCEANRIEAFIDGRTLAVPYGSSLADTSSICGDINNGYALAINWDEFGDGEHEVRLDIDGSEVGSRRFQVATPGGQGRVEGVQSRHAVADFPNRGDTLILQWSQPHQNYRIVDYRPNLTETLYLGASDDQTDLVGETDKPVRYFDFGGSDVYTLGPTLSGSVLLVDTQDTTVVLPVGLQIQAAEFASDGVRFLIDGFWATLLGDLDRFTFVFATVPRTFAATAQVFGIDALPAMGQPTVIAPQVGTVQSDGSLGAN
jgi:hypothetical protein